MRGGASPWIAMERAEPCSLTVNAGCHKAARPPVVIHCPPGMIRRTFEDRFPSRLLNGGRLDLATANFNRIEAADGRYRPDIDGLRALAVLSVLLFHFRVSPFRGGFVGVDIFFVISGFLITRLIWSEIGAGRFSFLGFYERRARRILPALFAMLALVTIASTILLFPQMLANYAMSLIATAGFASNFHFWGYTSYWAPAAVEQPLLHTWSLAVEEQFYLIFPPFLLLFRKRSQRVLLWALLGALAVSLCISIVSVRYSPVSAFYLLPSRFWELLIGSVLAVGRFAAPAGVILRNAIAAVGLALIGYGVFALSAASPFPGLNAIPPCLGAALVIYAGTGMAEAEHVPLVNVLLGTRLPVFVGLISYSLYLWHWPIIVLANAVLPHDLDAGQTIVAIAASFLLAVLSWRYVEQPFRGRASRISRKPLFVSGGAAIAVFAVVGLVLAAVHGWPQRYDEGTQRILAEANKEPMRSHCFNPSVAKITQGGLCSFGAPNAAPTFLLWGDSHADAMLPAVLLAAREAGKAGLVAAHGHCAPLVGATVADPDCRPFNDAVLKIALQKNIAVVLLDARWAGAAGVPSVEGEPLGVTFSPVAQPPSYLAQREAMFADAFAHTVKLLEDARKKIVIIGPLPEFQNSVPTDIAKMRIWHEQWEIAPTRREFLAREAFVDSIFEKLAADSHVTLVWPDRVLCPDSYCAILQEGLPLYRDSNHLSVFGAERLAPLYRGLL